MTDRHLQVKILHPKAKAPARLTPGSAGLDLYAIESGIIPPHKKHIIRTGISLIFPIITDRPDSSPIKIYGSIRSRSGLSAKYDIEVGAGVIDADYTGEIKVVLRNHGDVPFKYQCGDRIAQLILETYVHAIPIVIDNFNPAINFSTATNSNELSRSNIRLNGFGSTG